MSELNPDDAFSEIAISSGFMTAAQVQLCREASEQARALGAKAMPQAQVALDRRFLSIQQIEHVEQLMMERGCRPRLGGLELLNLIGSGGMGAVYRARQVGLDRVVAVKVLKLELAGDKEFIARFQREARLAAQIWHPKAIQVFDVGFDLGRHYMVMEYVDGVPLSKMLGGHPLDEGWALRVIRDAAEPLAKAHSLGIIHRDIKPGNILVGRDGGARLSDLGLAKSTLGGEELTLTHTGSISGTPYYMSPEQCRGERDADQRTDIYSLGVTLYLMVCGKLPFDGPTPFVVMHKHVAEPLPDPRSQNPALTGAVAELIRDMTAKERENRIQTCEEVLSRIASILAALPPAVAPYEAATMLSGGGRSGSPVEAGVESAPLTSTREGPPRRSRRRTWLAALAAIVPLCSLAAWLTLRPRPPERATQGEEPAATAAAPVSVARSPARPAPPAVVTPGMLRVPQDFRAAPGAKAEPYTNTGWARDIVHEASGVEMVFIPAGEFLMGSPDSETGRLPREGPQHRVRISRPFYMGKYEVTQGQWEKVMGRDPSHFTGDDRLPLEQVSWNDCQEFSTKLGDSLRLATEAEWEYACRAGTTTAFCFGATVSSDRVNCDGNFAYLDAPKGECRMKTTPVGLFPPNAWGLYDMHGNVQEWCQEWFGEGYYAQSPAEDPKGPASGSARVLRGGAWGNVPRDSRSAVRGSLEPDSSNLYTGLRLALGLD